MKIKMVTLYEIRIVRPFGTEPLGKRKLRSRNRAIRIARRLRTMGIVTELHKWSINPSGLHLDRLISKGTAVEACATLVSRG